MQRVELHKVGTYVMGHRGDVFIESKYNHFKREKENEENPEKSSFAATVLIIFICLTACGGSDPIVSKRKSALEPNCCMVPRSLKGRQMLHGGQDCEPGRHLQSGR